MFHPPIELLINSLTQRPRSISNVDARFNFGQANFEAINNELPELDWNLICNEIKNIDGMVTELSVIKAVIVKH